MSECVVRMEMPESCDICPCLDDYGDYPRCRISGEQRGYNFPIREKRMPNCPIICQLPDGHGRLGDLDALTRLMLERKQPLVGADSSKDRYRYMQWLADFNAIKDVKTVVPAERRRI